MTHSTYLLLSILLAAANITTWTTSAAQPENERLLYEMIVTTPGSKMQGWYGVLYDDAGRVIQLKPGEQSGTPAMTLVGVAKSDGEYWKPYGAIPVGGVPENIILSAAWNYKLVLTNLQSKCPSWRGELRRDGVLFQPTNGSSVTTSFGQFAWSASDHGWVQPQWNVSTTKCG